MPIASALMGTIFSCRAAVRSPCFASCARGVAERLMRVEALGESKMLVQTRDEVPELQNRRVEIKFEVAP